MNSSSHRTGSRLSPLAHSICALVFASLGASGLAAEAVFSSGAFTGDADSGVSNAKTYTAIANIIGNNVAVNGVNGATFIGSGGALSGTGWALTGVPNQFGGGGNHTTTFAGQAIAGLFDGFQFNGSPGTLTLSGLTVGQTYVATLYNQAWTLPDYRPQAVTSSEGASILYNEDALEASALRYTFVATGATTTLDFAPQRSGYSMHFYGVSNEQVFNNSWVSGTTASTSAWTAATPFDVGKSASFGAQGAPTNFDLDVPVTTGHVQFDGANAWTVTGASTLTLQADAGGTSVLSALSGTHTIAAAVQLNSPVAKFGAGTIRLTGAVAGSGKGVTIGAGTLAIESSTADLSSLGNIADGSTLAINNAAAQKIDTVISGTGGLTKNGNGTLTLGGYQTYGGPTVINAGTLKLSAINTLAIANPSFQTHDALANGSYGYTPTGATWSFNGGSVAGIALNGGPFFNPTNHDGNAGGFIQGGSISQSINVTNTGYYNFSFQGVSRGTPYGPIGLLFQVDGTTVKAFDPTEFSDATWQNYTATVNLTPGAHNIAFVANNLSGGGGSDVIDLVTGASGGLLPSNSAVSLTASGATLDLSGAVQTIGSLAGVAGTSVLNDGSLTTGGSGISGDFAGGISGTGSFTKTGGGAMTLSGTNTYGGSTTVSGGTLRLTGGTLPTGTALSLPASGATFDLNGSSVNVGSLAGVAGSAVTLLNGTLTAGSNNSSTTFAGAISGAGGSLVKSGTGTLTLSGANTYSGGTTINGGTLLSGSAAATGSGQVAIGASGTWNLGVETPTIAGLVGDGNVTRTGIVTTGADGSTTISNSKTYVQALNFAGGALTINGVSFAAAGTSGTGYALTGATNGYGGGPTPTGNGGGASYNTLLQNFYYGGNPGVLTFTGLTAGKVYEAVVFSNQAWGTRPQNATFAGGSDTQQLLATDPLNNGYYSYKFVADGSTASITMAPLNGNDTYHWFGATLADVGTSNSTLTLGSASNYVFNGNVSGATSIVKVGSGRQELNGSNTYTGSTAINGGSLQFGSGSLSGAITGTGTLIKAGNGTLTLSGASNYSGGTTINGGTLLSGSATATGSGQVAIGASGTWNLGVETPTIAGLVGDGNVTRTGIVTTGADGSTTISNSKTYVQALNFAGGALTINGVSFAAAGTSGTGYALTGATNGYGGGPTPTGNGGGASYNTLLQNFYYGGNPGVLTFTGLTAGEVYEAVVFSNQAWATRPQNATFASGSDSLQLVGTDPHDNGYYSYKFVADGTTASITMAPLNGNDTYHWYGATLADLGTTLSTLTLGSASNYVFSGVITGLTNLVKQGPGTQTLSGANTYTGFTAINNGVLSISASSNLGDGSATNTITINGGKLRDTGAGVNLGVNRSVTIGASGGTIEVTTGASLTVPGAISGPGNTLTKTGNGTLTLSGPQTYATLNANAGVTNLNSALGTGASTLNANATVNINASQTLASLTIADGVEVTFGDGLPFAGGPDKLGAVVPEPGSMALLLAGALGLAARRRRGV